MRDARCLLVGLRTFRPARSILARTPALRPGRTRRTLTFHARSGRRGRRTIKPFPAFPPLPGRPLKTAGRRQGRTQSTLRQIAPLRARANVRSLEPRPAKTLRPRRHGRTRPRRRPQESFTWPAETPAHPGFHRSLAIPSHGRPAFHLRPARPAFRGQEAVQPPLVLRRQAARIHLLLQILELLLQFADAVTQALLFLGRHARLLASGVFRGTPARRSLGGGWQLGGQQGGQQTSGKESSFHDLVRFRAQSAARFWAIERRWPPFGWVQPAGTQFREERAM
jgi:hypothetical protein